MEFAMKMDCARKKLMGMLDGSRYLHSLGVSETASRLAVKYGADPDKASLAGLVHDCAKSLSGGQLLKEAFDANIEVDYVDRAQPGLLHGPVGAVIARREFAIDDDEILDSIRYHTTGREDMTLLDKIIYIADYIEPGRNFPGVEELRTESAKDLDRGIMMAMDGTIEFVLERKMMLDLKTVRARNFMLRCETSAKEKPNE